MGDVSNDVQFVLDRLGIDEPWDELYELGTILGRRGVTTLYGTTLIDEDESTQEPRHAE